MDSADLFEIFRSQWGVWTSQKTDSVQQLERILATRHASFRRLDSEILKMCESKLESPHERERKLLLTSKITSALQANPQLRMYDLTVHMTGSSASGFACARSDLDICIAVPGCSARPIKKTQVAILRLVRAAMERPETELGLYRKIELIKAKVPILRFVYHDSEIGAIPVDMSARQEYPPASARAARLLSDYAKVDTRVIPFVLLVKHWADERGIHDVRRLLNSYGLVLLSIHFLQCGMPVPVLPSLQYLADKRAVAPGKIDAGVATNILPSVPIRNGHSVSELFFLFVAYYACTPIERCFIAVKDGRLFRRPDRIRRDRIHIVDPIDGHDVTRALRTWSHVLQVFRETHALFCNERIFLTLPEILRKPNPHDFIPPDPTTRRTGQRSLAVANVEPASSDDDEEDDNEEDEAEAEDDASQAFVPPPPSRPSIPAAASSASASSSRARGSAPMQAELSSSYRSRVSVPRTPTTTTGTNSNTSSIPPRRRPTATQSFSVPATPTTTTTTNSATTTTGYASSRRMFAPSASVPTTPTTTTNSASSKQAQAQAGQPLVSNGFLIGAAALAGLAGAYKYFASRKK